MLSRVRLFATPWTTVGSTRFLCPRDSPGNNTFVLEVAFILESKKEVTEECFGLSPFLESSKRGKPCMLQSVQLLSPV